MIVEAATYIAVIIGLTQIIKEVGLPGKYATLAAVVLGCTVPLVPSNILQGIIYGLSATGLFRGTKTMVQTPRETSQ